MSVGNSGRVVIEVDPEMKKMLYSHLIQQGLTLKDWFILTAEQYLHERNQLSLGFDSTPTAKEAQVHERT